MWRPQKGEELYNSVFTFSGYRISTFAEVVVRAASSQCSLWEISYSAIPELQFLIIFS